MPWRVRGSYLESCNCDAICPCRRVDGLGGGRSTHGICLGALSWLIDEGEAVVEPRLQVAVPNAPVTSLPRLIPDYFPANAGVLSESDFKKVEQIKPLFLNLMGDLVQTSKRPDLAGGDSECIKATIQELLQISQELSSYEYLITIEREMTDFGENSPMRDVIKFAIENSNTILTNERKRLVLLSDQCVRFPLSLMGDVEALRRGEPQVIDVAALPRGPEAEALLASGVHTYMVVPMIAGGELIGGLSFGGAPGEFSPEQIGIAQEVAAQLAIALAQARLHERVKRQAEELEQRVQERTRELSTANEQLQREVAERQRAEADADRANRAKSEFLSRMSHELRTPLNAILGFAQLLELEVERPADRESVEQIAKGGRHLLTLINEILDIARIEAGQLPLSPEPVRVGDAIQRVLDLTRPLAATRRIELETGGAALHPEHVWADQQRLQQVLLNLVSNGIKYNRDAGRLTVACDAAEADRIRISVKDTGPGIAPALRERLFQPFDRLGAEQHGVEGTGLGLALSKRLVEAMGGTIGVESVPSAGSTFWVEFLRAESPIDRLARTEPSPAVLAAPAERDGTVLYIEDNLSNLRLVERTLALRPGVKLIPAMQGRLGLALAQQHRPDLILLDLHLPDISGEQVLRELQGDPGLRQTPVVVLSADATPGQVQRLLAAGVRAYLTKPLDVRQLLALLDEVLRTGGGA